MILSIFILFDVFLINYYSDGVAYISANFTFVR